MRGGGRTERGLHSQGAGRLTDPGQLLAIAAEALGRYKLRTFLSILGVILGVAAVIAMMSVIEGGRRESLRQVGMLGLDNLVVRNRSLTTSQTLGAGPTGLTVDDARRLAALVPRTAAVAPLIQRNLTIFRDGNASVTSLLGVDSSYQTVVGLRAGRGRLFSTVDDRAGARVCVLGAALARQLFGYENPIGQFVRIETEYFGVIGVLGEQDARSPALGALAWRDLGGVVLAPLSAVSGLDARLMSEQQVDEIWLQAEDGEEVEPVGKVLLQTMTRLHEGRPDFDVVIPREQLAQRYRTQRTFSVAVGAIAAIALLIGGIGIMNIMLTSVVERTREIGVRRTVGATQNDITLQFLTESVLMTLTGGLLGILIGVASAPAITFYAGWSTYVSPLAVLLAIVVSMGVGLGFGLYPAMKAARLEPVDALRYE